MNRLLFLLVFILFLCCETTGQDSISENSVQPIQPDKKNVVFAELMSEEDQVKPENVAVDTYRNFFIGRIKSEENYSICIDTASFKINPKQTYIKLIGMESLDQFDSFMEDSVFHSPFKDGTLHSIEFRTDNQIVTQIKNFEGLLKTFRSYKKEGGVWKIKSAGFYNYKEEYVHPF